MSSLSAEISAYAGSKGWPPDAAAAAGRVAEGAARGDIDKPAADAAGTAIVIAIASAAGAPPGLSASLGASLGPRVGARMVREFKTAKRDPRGWLITKSAESFLGGIPMLVYRGAQAVRGKPATIPGGIRANPRPPARRSKAPVADPPFLSLAVVESFLPEIRAEGVSKVARSSVGFIPAYRRAGGPAGLPPAWRRKRAAFVARHMAQVRQNGEALFETDGRPTRRHLALIAWAYSPSPGQIIARNPSDAKALEIQSLVFDRAIFDGTAARDWARRNGFKVPKIHVTTNTIRIRQRAPSSYRKASFITKSLTVGVQAVMGKRK